jgi:hypothetical protein
VAADVVELAGADALVQRAREHLAAGRPLQAIHLAELVAADHPGVRDVLRQANENLLSGSTNFWERAWLTEQIERNS